MVLQMETWECASAPLQSVSLSLGHNDDKKHLPVSLRQRVVHSPWILNHTAVSDLSFLFCSILYVFICFSYYTSRGLVSLSRHGKHIQSAEGKTCGVLHFVSLCLRWWWRWCGVDGDDTRLIVGACLFSLLLHTSYTPPQKYLVAALEMIKHFALVFIFTLAGVVIYKTMAHSTSTNRTENVCL